MFFSVNLNFGYNYVKWPGDNVFNVDFLLRTIQGDGKDEGQG